MIISIYEKPKDNKIKEEYMIIDNGIDGWNSIAGLYILNKRIFTYLKKVRLDENGEYQLTDAIKIALDAKDVILGIMLIKGKRVDIGSWNYLKDEKKFYHNMTDLTLDELIKSRNSKMLSRMKMR